MKKNFFKKKNILKLIFRLAEFIILFILYCLKYWIKITIKGFSYADFSYNFNDTISILDLIQNVIIINVWFQWFNSLIDIIYYKYLIMTKNFISKFNLYWFLYKFFSDYILSFLLNILIILNWIYYYKDFKYYIKYCDINCDKFKSIYWNSLYLFIIILILSIIISLMKIIDIILNIINITPYKKTSNIGFNNLNLSLNLD